MRYKKERRKWRSKIFRRKNTTSWRKLTVTSNSLAKQSSFRESSFVLMQANYQELQSIAKQKWSKRLFLTSNLEIPIHSLVSLLVPHENAMLILWLAVNNMRPQQKLLFLFYVKKYFLIKKKRRKKLMTFLINQVFFSYEIRNYTSFAKMNIIFITITKAQPLSLDKWNIHYPSLKFCNSYLLKNFTLSKALFFVINRFCLSCVSFFILWLFNPYDNRGNPQLVFFWKWSLYLNSYNNVNLSVS